MPTLEHAEDIDVGLLLRGGNDDVVEFYEMASLTIPSWNQIIFLLRELEALRKLSA